VDDQEIDRRI